MKLILQSYIGLLCGENCMIPTSTVFAAGDGRAYATELRLSYVVCYVCIVAKRCILQQKLLLAAIYEVVYEKSIGTKMNDLDLCLEVVYGHVNDCVTFAIEYLENRSR